MRFQGRKFSNRRTVFLKHLLLQVVICAALFGSCSELDPPPIDAKVPVIAIWSGNDLSVTNNTSQTIYFVAFPVRLLPVILWTPITNPNTALQVSAQATKKFPRSRFSANNPDTLMFSWWHLGMKLTDSLYNPDSVRTLSVQ